MMYPMFVVKAINSKYFMPGQTKPQVFSYLMVCYNYIKSLLLLMIGVGIKVGEDANIMRIVMQIHFHRRPSTKGMFQVINNDFILL